MKKPKDIVDREINKGDFVVYSHSGRNLNMQVCYVTDITPSGQLKAVGKWDCKIPKPEKSCFRIEAEELPEDTYYDLIRKGHPEDFDDEDE